MKKDEITVSLSIPEARRLLHNLRVTVLTDHAGINYMPLVQKLDQELKRRGVRHVRIEVLSVKTREDGE